MYTNVTRHVILLFPAWSAWNQGSISYNIVIVTFNRSERGESDFHHETPFTSPSLSKDGSPGLFLIVSYWTGLKEWLIARYGPVPGAEGFPACRDLPGIFWVHYSSNLPFLSSPEWTERQLEIGLRGDAHISSAFNFACCRWWSNPQYSYLFLLRKLTSLDMGMITAAWAGLIHGLLAGCQVNIVGPPGAIASILGTYVVRYGQGIAPFLGIITGCANILFPVTK